MVGNLSHMMIYSGHALLKIHFTFLDTMYIVIVTLSVGTQYLHSTADDYRCNIIKVIEIY